MLVAEVADVRLSLLMSICIFQHFAAAEGSNIIIV